MHPHHSHRVIPSLARPGITRVEVLVVFGVCTMLMGLIPPAILSAREEARRAQNRNSIIHWSVSFAYSRNSATSGTPNPGYLPPAPPTLPDWEADLIQMDRITGAVLFVIAATMTALLVKVCVGYINRRDEAPFQPDYYR
jgi:hypothetical protein